MNPHHQLLAHLATTTFHSPQRKLIKGGVIGTLRQRGNPVVLERLTGKRKKKVSDFIQLCSNNTQFAGLIDDFKRRRNERLMLVRCVFYLLCTKSDDFCRELTVWVHLQFTRDAVITYCLAIGMILHSTTPCHFSY